MRLRIKVQRGVSSHDHLRELRTSISCNPIVFSRNAQLQANPIFQIRVNSRESFAARSARRHAAIESGIPQTDAAPSIISYQSSPRVPL